MSKIKKYLLMGLDLGINVVIIVILVFVIQKWIVAPFDVYGASMCDTLNFIDNECTNDYGEKIIINEAKYIVTDPARGDIVVFSSPNEDDKYFIKRVIGLPGDTVEIHDGQVYVNGTQIDEPYLNDSNKGNTKIYLSGLSVFDVPEDHYFLLGDNRAASTDSRSCFESTISLKCKDTPEKAFIERENIRGSAWVVWWPLKNMRLIDHPNYPSLSQSNSDSFEEK